MLLEPWHSAHRKDIAAANAASSPYLALSLSLSLSLSAWEWVGQRGVIHVSSAPPVSPHGSLGVGVAIHWACAIRLAA
jgi:hypothetical protein